MKVLLKIIFIFLLFPIKTYAFENPKVKINNFFIQKYEVTIAEFSNFANKTNFKTEAEKQGIDPMVTLDNFKRLPPGNLDEYTAAFLNLERVGTSFIGIRVAPVINKYVQRLIKF